MTKDNSGRESTLDPHARSTLNLPRRRLVLGAAALLLVACSRRQVRRDAADLLAADQEVAARRLRRFRIQGRVALSDGEQGGSGRLIWQQSETDLDVRFSAPLTQRTWRLQRDPLGARLIDDRGEVAEAAELQQLLDRVWGVGVPVDALAYWLRGSRLPGSGRISLDPQGRLLQVQQRGWTIDYLSWHEASSELPVLPKKVYASNGERWVRVVIQRWQTSDG